MKLILINYEYPPLGGGAGNATAHLGYALRELGYEVTVVTAALRGNAGASEDRGVRVWRIRALRRRVDCASLLEMLSYVVHACWRVPVLARCQKADGCIVFFSLPCGPVGWLTRQLAGTPYVVALRGGDVPGAEASVGGLQRLLGPVRRRVLGGARAITANSHGLAAISKATDPFEVDVIPNGVDTRAFCPPAEPRPKTGTTVLMFAGRFNTQKNLPLLLRQFSEALKHEPHLRLVLVGDGPHRERLHALARELGIAAHLDWRGWLAKPELAALYRSVDVFVNPSLYEGMPNTVLEAMACGLPVIASAVAGNDELVVDQQTGLLFDLQEADALAAAIVALASDPATRARYGRAGRNAAESLYSWDATARRYARYFQTGV